MTQAPVGPTGRATISFHDQYAAWSVQSSSGSHSTSPKLQTSWLTMRRIST
jgi:hypothetical protein